MSQRLIATRASNKDRHPGAPDMPAPRRSSEVVQRDLAAQKAASLEAQSQQQQNIRRIAEMENELQGRSIERQGAFAKPTSQVACMLQGTVMVPNIAHAMPQGRRLQRTESVLDVTATPHGEIEPQGIAQMAGNSEGADKEAAASDGTETDKEGTSPFILDLDAAGDSDIDNHKASVAASGQAQRKSGKKGKAVRDDIETIRKQLANKPNNAKATQYRTPLKRKGGDVDAHTLGHPQLDTRTSKKPKVQVGGLKPQYARLYKGSERVNAVNETDRAVAPMTDTFGGLSDEEEQHWQASWAPTAAFKSHKSAKAPTTIKLTKVIPLMPQRRLEYSNTIVNATSGAKPRPSCQDIPQGAEQLFRESFIPMVRRFAGTLENPWNTEHMTSSIQVIWDATIAGTPAWEHQFSDENDPLYRLTMQRIYEWRNHIGNGALEALKKFWASDLKYRSSGERKAYVQDALSPALPFLYGDMKKLDEGCFAVAKSYQGPLIMQALASHLKDSDISLDDETRYEFIDLAEPYGALILAVTAAERALTMFKTGHEASTTHANPELRFSDQNWGETAMRYSKSIQRLSKTKLEEIFNVARGYLVTKKARGATRGSVTGKSVMEDTIDIRAQIMPSSDVEQSVGDEGEYERSEGDEGDSKGSERDHEMMDTQDY